MAKKIPQKNQARPLLVQIIFFYFVFYFLYSFYPFQVIFQTTDLLTAEQRHILAMTYALDFLMAALAAIASLASALALLYLKKIAPLLWLISSIIGVGNYIFMTVSGNWLESVDHTDAILCFALLMPVIGSYFYAKRLAAKNVLR